MRLGLAACLLAIAGAGPAQAAGIALVLAIDVSESVSSERYILQHDGIARAFEAPQLIDAIAAVPGGIEALVLEWSDPDKIAITVGWTRIANRSAAAAFSGSALLAAAAAFDHMPEPAGHRVIDISGDGMANFGAPPAAVRDGLVRQGI